MNSVYLITLDKEEARIDPYKDKYNDVEDVLDIVWSNACSEKEARKVFDEIVRKIVREYRSNRSINKKFRTIRLWAPDGVQLKWES